VYNPIANLGMKCKVLIILFPNVEGKESATHCPNAILALISNLIIFKV
jgi:hypothetical protein